MIKTLLSIFFIHVTVCVFSQQIHGLYNNDNEFLNIRNDSTVEFALYVDTGNTISLLEHGKGHWNLLDSFMFIDVISPTISSKYEKTSEFTDSLRIYDLLGLETLPFVNCLFYDENDSLFWGGSTDFDGWFSINKTQVDSVSIHFNRVAPFGFKPEKNFGYNVYLELNDALIKGQIILKIDDWNEKSLTFQFKSFLKNSDEYYTIPDQKQLKSNNNPTTFLRKVN